MRAAFTVFGGEGWTGGINYLRNLLSAVEELPDSPIEPLLFHSPDVDRKLVEILVPYLAQPPIVVEGWRGAVGRRATRLAGSMLLQRDWVSEAVFRKASVDVVFQHAAWYGLAFPIPTLAWIADFQHKHLPNMFSRLNNLKRDLGYAALSHCATRIMVSSEDARADCERFFPRMRARISVLPFCVQLPEQTQNNPTKLKADYGLPNRYFFLPNQLWRHKNHLGLLEGLRLLAERGSEVVVVASGNPKDGRNPDHPQRVFEMVTRYHLESRFRFLGMIPYEHIMPLMRGSVAVINPSLFEGWSTTVEEAKALGVPLLLSNLGVHQEQAADVARFFDPTNPRSIADCLEAAWQELDVNGRIDRETKAVAIYQKKRRAFAEGFSAVLASTLEAT